MSKCRKYITPMKGWNFRVVRHLQPDGDPYYAIHEAYYSEKGISITVDPIHVGSEEAGGIEWQLHEMHSALTKPIIDHSTLKNVSERAAVFEMAHPTQDHRSKCPACDRGERVITPPATRILGPGAQELEKLRNAKSK